ncbi:MAG: hypothetical protein LAT51_09155 [Flavobacteriaceae bacterium]|nr:hypothetical protein [Flavobacteriaceae bacterium]
MKRLLSLVLLSFLMIACESNVDSGSPVVQAEIDGSLFRSKAQIVKDNEDNFVLRASNVDVLNIRLSDVSPGIYEIGPNTDNQVTFRRDGDLFVSNGPGTGGVLEIERADSLSMWGNFNFNLRLNGSGRLLNVNKGVFFDVPFEIFEEIEFPEVEENVSENNFLDATVAGENYEAISVVANTSAQSVEIEAFDANNNLIVLLVPIGLGETGSFSIEEEGVDAIFSDNILEDVGNPNINANQGEINITTYTDEAIIGTFSFTTAGETEVTEGEFEVTVFEE